MIGRFASSLLLLGVFACERSRPSVASNSQATQAAPTNAEIATWTVRPDAYGRLVLGIPLADANALLGDSIPVDYKKFDTCQSVSWATMPRGVRLMVERDSVGSPPRLERVDIDSAGVRTAEGASVGDPESRIQQLYGSRVRVQPHKYTSAGHYLIVDAVDDTLHRIVFETDGQRVVKYRAGHRPAVDYVESCG